MVFRAPTGTRVVRAPSGTCSARTHWDTYGILHAHPLGRALARTHWDMCSSSTSNMSCGGFGGFLGGLSGRHRAFFRRRMPSETVLGGGLSEPGCCSLGALQARLGGHLGRLGGLLGRLILASSRIILIRHTRAPFGTCYDTHPLGHV